MNKVPRSIQVSNTEPKRGQEIIIEHKRQTQTNKAAQNHRDISKVSYNNARKFLKNLLVTHKSTSFLSENSAFYL